MRHLLDSRAIGWGLLAGLFAAMLLSLMARPVIDHVPLYDELLHVLSARGLIATGEPAIADGLYTRAALFTRLIAAALTSFGDTMTAARLPSLFAAIGLVVVTALCVTRRVNLLAGLVAGVILIMVPPTLELAVFVRFYTLHALVIAVMAVLAYLATEPGKTTAYRAVLAVSALLLTGLAWHLQSTTAIAAGGLMAGVAALMIMDHWPLVREILRRYPWQVGITLVVVLGGGLAAIDKLGLLDQMGEVPLWAAWAADMPHFYVKELTEGMPLLWPLFPIALIVAVLTHRRLAVFCAVIFLSALFVHSIAAAKSFRYIYYLFPFFAAIWGCAIAGANGYLQGYLRTGWAVPALAALTLAVSVEGQRTAKLIVGRASAVESLSYAVEAEWSPAMPVLKPLAASADRVVTSNAMKSLYYLGRYDYELNASIVAETEEADEFGRDPRTGRQAIGTPASMTRVLDMPGATLVVLEAEMLNLSRGVTTESLAVIDARCTSVAVPPQAEIRAWICKEGGGSS
jgi:hypothetical protein